MLFRSYLSQSHRQKPPEKEGGGDGDYAFVLRDPRVGGGREVVESLGGARERGGGAEEGGAASSTTRERKYTCTQTIQYTQAMYAELTETSIECAVSHV
jgi:hypothetical protein